MKKRMIICNLGGMISIFLSFFCNFIRGEGSFIFVFIIAPLLLVLIFSIIAYMHISNYEKDKLKKQLSWILIINSLITLIYYIFTFKFAIAVMLPFGIVIAIAFFTNITLLIMVLFSQKLFRIIYTGFTILFITSFIIQMLIFHATPKYEFQMAEDGKSYILKYNHIEGISITIPNSYNGLPITVIDGFLSSHIRYWQNIGTINFEPDSQIVIIGEYAFLETDAKEINLPDSIQIIEENAFAYSKIKEITIPDNVTFIGRYAFDSSSLKKIVIPKSVTTMENEIFKDCNDITIYCEAQSKPIGWSEDWASGITNANIVWGYEG